MFFNFGIHILASIPPSLHIGFTGMCPQYAPPAQVVGRALTDTALECTTPSVPTGGTVSVTVALRYTNTKHKTDFTIKNGAGESGNEMFFHFYPSEVASGIRPYEGPSRGGTAVTVTGSEFRNTPDLVVRFSLSRNLDNTTADSIDSVFAATTVPGRFVSIGEVAVDAPRCPLGSGKGGFFSVEVSSNGVDFSGSADAPLYFYDASEPFIETLSPVTLREGGGVVITVRGSGFPETYPSTLECAFGNDEPVPAIRHSAEVLTCVAPSRRPGPAVVTVTSYGQSIPSEGDLTVEYISALRVLSSWPLLGPAAGGTAVTVLGEGFRADEAYACAFGLYQPPVSATLVNTSAIVCQTPTTAGKEAGEVTLEVLNVQGDGLTRGRENAYRYTFTEEHTDITMPVVVENDGNRTSQLLFQYYDDIELFRVSPANGPAAGGTVVRVSGSGFLDQPQAACRFGTGAPSPARIIDAWTLVCTTNDFASAAGVPPRMERPAFNTTSRFEKGVTVRVTMNGVDYSPANTSTSFLYDDDIAVLSLFPDRGPSAGGMQVIVRGSGFRQDKQLACRFGLQVVEAEYLRNDTIACLAPRQVRLSVVSVSVTLNGQDFAPGHAIAATAAGNELVSQGPLFTYADCAFVTALRPDKGPTRGGTIVRISGVNFANSTVVLCRFGTAVVTASFSSTELLTCVSPAVPVGTGRVYLEVSDHGMLNSSSGNNQPFGLPADPGNDPMLWTDSGVEFRFTADAEVLAAFPASGPSTGGTRVSLTGSGFEDLLGLMCRFGGAPLGGRIDKQLGHTSVEEFRKTGVEVPATYVSPTEVMCIAPEQSLEWDPDSTTAGGTVRVAVTLNGQDYGLRMAQFTYYPAPMVSGGNTVCVMD